MNSIQIKDSEKQEEILAKGLCPYCGNKRKETSNRKVACCGNYATACEIVEKLENRILDPQFKS